MSTHVCPDGDTEAEPVLVEQDGSSVHLLLDCGTRITFERDELLEACAPLSYDRREAVA